MSNVINVQPWQALGVGNPRELLQEVFADQLTAFNDKAQFQMATVVDGNKPGGGAFVFDATWKATTSRRKKGTALTGENAPESEKRTVVIDEDPINSHSYYDIGDEQLSNRGSKIKEYARQHSEAVSLDVEAEIAQSIALGARQTARSLPSGLAFPAGNLLDSPRTGPVGTAYPRTLSGSKALQDDFNEIARKMRINNIPLDEARGVMFIDPYLEEVLRQDVTLFSRDFSTVNDIMKGTIAQTPSWDIVVTNNMPSTNVTTGDAAYRGDFTKTVALAVGHSTAVHTGFLKPGVRHIGPVWIDTHQGWLIGTEVYKGSGWTRPEACGEIALA